MSDIVAKAFQMIADQKKEPIDYTPIIVNRLRRRFGDDAMDVVDEILLFIPYYLPPHLSNWHDSVNTRLNKSSDFFKNIKKELAKS